jgi:hypothetical protein
VYEHGTKDPEKALKWNFNSGCALGGMIGCFPESNNPENQKMPNIPKHNNFMPIMNGDKDTAKADREKWNRLGAPDGKEFNEKVDPADEHGMPVALDNATSDESLSEMMAKLCECCENVTLIIDVRGNRMFWIGPNDLISGIDNYSKRWRNRLKNGKNTFNLKCSDAKHTLDK